MINDIKKQLKAACNDVRYAELMPLLGAMVRFMENVEDKFNNHGHDGTPYGDEEYGSGVSSTEPIEAGSISWGTGTSSRIGVRPTPKGYCPDCETKLEKLPVSKIMACPECCSHDFENEQEDEEQEETPSISDLMSEKPKRKRTPRKRKVAG
jgi:hypothetical protein